MVSYMRLSLRGWLLIIGIMMLALVGYGQAVAQGPTATAVQISIPTLTPTAVKTATITPTSNAPTEFAAGLARVEAKDKTTGANLRAAPSTDSEKLDTIFPGAYFAVIGRSNKWLLIKYDKSPNGLAWVYQDIVNVTGLSVAQIPTVDSNSVPTANVSTAAAQQTLISVTQTPGGNLTVTAIQGSATGVYTRAPGQSAPGVTSSPGPTFTYPAGFAEATLPPRQTSAPSQGGIPPIVPILALAGVGLFGLLVSALRRM